MRQPGGHVVKYSGLVHVRLLVVEVDGLLLEDRSDPAEALVHQLDVYHERSERGCRPARHLARRLQRVLVALGLELRGDVHHQVLLRIGQLLLGQELPGLPALVAHEQPEGLAAVAALRLHLPHALVEQEDRARPLVPDLLLAFLLLAVAKVSRIKSATPEEQDAGHHPAGLHEPGPAPTAESAVVR